MYMYSIVGIYGSHFTFSHTLSLNQMHEIPAIISVRPQLPFVSDPNLTDGIQVVWVPLQVYYLQACYPKLFIQSSFSSILGITPTLLCDTCRLNLLGILKKGKIAPDAFWLHLSPCHNHSSFCIGAFFLSPLKDYPFLVVPFFNIVYMK